MTDYKLVPVKRCAACGNEKPVSEMETCMHNQMHRYVCDSKCMNDFYSPPKKQSPDDAAPAVQGEPFMYGIAGPGGRPHFDEFCVSSEAHHLIEEVDALNQHSAEGQYRLVALYAAPQPAEQQPRAPYRFDRYINGVLMAEGVLIEKAASLEDAAAMAVRLASKGPNGEAPVLVLDSKRINQQPAPYILDAITGALASGKQGISPPPKDHWLTPYWEMGNAERELQSAPAVAGLVEALEQAQGFLRNKGYSEKDPLLLGAINAALAVHRGQGG